MAAIGFACSDEQGTPVRERGPACPDLLSVHDKFLAVSVSASSDGCEVGTSLWLGKALAPDVFTGKQRGQEIRPLLHGAVGADRGSDHIQADQPDRLWRTGTHEFGIEH